MESRKYYLQQQIIEALKAKDNDLYLLLKSQWAHRFGVESLEELKNLELNELNQNFTSQVEEKVDKSKYYFREDEKIISVKVDDNQKKEIIEETNKPAESVEDENKESFEIKSDEIVDKENNKNKFINKGRENKNQPRVKALIPIPPKPKYGYLQKWILRNKL